MICCGVVLWCVVVLNYGMLWRCIMVCCGVMLWYVVALCYGVLWCGVLWCCIMVCCGVLCSMLGLGTDLNMLKKVGMLKSLRSSRVGIQPSRRPWLAWKPGNHHTTGRTVA